MADARELTDEAVHQLDRLSSVILDDIGEGPAPQDLVARALKTREAVATIGIPALNELTGLVVALGNSMVAGATDWSPSLGGTLMAAVDDLRTLVTRADQFSSEDSEHLHHRAAELAVYVRISADAPPAPTVTPPAVPSVPAPEASAPPQPALTSAPTPNAPLTPTPTNATAAISPAASNVVPISSLFFAEGPQVVSGGVPAAAGKTSDLLGAGIDALENLTAQPLAVQALSGPMVVVPVETLLYRGRAALERAAAIREQIKTSGTQASPAALDEMYDLIGLALKD